MHTDAEKISGFWGVDCRGRRTSWAENPAVLDYMHKHVTGNPKLGTYLCWAGKYFQKPAELALSLGCGFGGFERD